MERVVRINLVALIGISVALAALVIPAFTERVYRTGEWSPNGQGTILDIVTEDAPQIFNVDVALGVFATLCLAGIITSVITPIGGYLLLFAGLSVLFRLPYVWSYRLFSPSFSWIWFGLESGPILMVVASLIIIVSVFLRIVVVGKSVRVEYGIDQIMNGLLTLSYGKHIQNITPRTGTILRANVLCIVGISLGLSTMLLSWTSWNTSGIIGLGVLNGDLDTYRDARFSLQVIMACFLTGLAASLYTPLGATVQMASVLAFIVSTNTLYSTGPWLGIASSLIIMHSVLVPARDAQGRPRLTIAQNLRTFVRI